MSKWKRVNIGEWRMPDGTPLSMAGEWKKGCFGPTLAVNVNGHDFESVQDLSARCKRCGNCYTLSHILSGAGVLPTCTGAGSVPVEKGKCECGAHKTIGAGRGAPGHSDWCPWR